MSLESAANLARRFYRSNPTVTWQNSTTYPYHIFFSQRKPWAGFVQILRDADFELLTSCSNMHPFLYIRQPPRQQQGERVRGPRPGTDVAEATSFTAMVFEPCDTVLAPERKGSQSQRLKLVSRQFRNSNVCFGNVGF